MKQLCPYLFVYGTLLNGNNSYGAYLQQHCTLLQSGKLRGRLYDIGEYPGAIPDTSADQCVHGSIYLIDEPEKILAFIDDYEGFGPNQDQPNLFIRIMVSVETTDAPIECWVYIYNLPIAGLMLIESGRYRL
jgi:gamma-glutamylcyclotransferase (GGCT)/AIG2-like uncharacterized protein YtfP